MEQRGLNRMFDALAPTSEQEQAVFDRLLQTERKGRPMKKLKKLTVIGIAAALMVISCAAAVVTGLDQRLLDYFGANPEQELLLSPTAVQVEKSHTYENGWTVDVRQAMSDRYSMAVLIDVTAPGGIDLTGEECYLRVEPSRQNGRYGYVSYHLTQGCRRLENEEPNRASYLFNLYYDSEKVDVLGSTWELTPECFQYEEQDGTVRELALEGWSCTVSLSEQDPGALYEIGQSFSINGRKATLNQVYISPISCTFRLKDIPSVTWHNEFGFESEDWKDLMTLHKISGEVVEMDTMFMGGMTMPNTDDPDVIYGYYQFRPEEFIDPAEITAVTIYGQTYELK